MAEFWTLIDQKVQVSDISSAYEVKSTRVL